MGDRIKLYIGLGLTGLAALLLFQNCSQVSFGTVSGQSTSSTPGGGTGGTGGGTGTGTTTGSGSGTTTTIRNFVPALATRDFSCLACHANIQSNLITDFGYDPSGKTSWYFDGFQNSSDFGQIHYAAITWQTIEQILGQVIVPQATVPASYANSQLASGATPYSSPVDLVTYLTNTNEQNLTGGWPAQFDEPVPTVLSWAEAVVPPTGKPQVVAQDTIFIGAPTAQQILAITANTAPAPWFENAGTKATTVSGLSVTTGVNGLPYITNSGPVQCSGQDIVINGTLLLNNLQLYAEKGGCRLYVTGSVFVEGPITYLNSGASTDPTDNLQITSATSILMGVGLNGEAVNGGNVGATAAVQDCDQYFPAVSSTYQCSPLNERLLGDVRQNMFLRLAPTTAAYKTYAAGVFNEGANIGLPLLQDASVPGSLPTAASGAIPPQMRASINFQHLLLNAPMIHSRYMGTVLGVIVAESAEFSLGEFSFQYDPVFATVPVLPALPYDILCSDSANCTPTTSPTPMPGATPTPTPTGT